MPRQCMSVSACTQVRKHDTCVHMCGYVYLLSTWQATLSKPPSLGQQPCLLLLYTQLSNITVDFWHIMTRKQRFFFFFSFLFLTFLTCIPLAFKYLMILLSDTDTPWSRKREIISTG